MSTKPEHYTSPAWAAQEARRQALESEAVALVGRFRASVEKIPHGSEARLLCEALCDGLTTDLRALATRPA